MLCALPTGLAISNIATMSWLLKPLEILHNDPDESFSGSRRAGVYIDQYTSLLSVSSDSPTSLQFGSSVTQPSPKHNILTRWNQQNTR